MKVFAFIFSFAALALAYPGVPDWDYALKAQELLMQYESGVLNDLQVAGVEKTATSSDLKIYLYTKRNIDNPVIIENGDIESLVNSGFFKSNSRIISITHGWNNDYSSEVNTLLTEAILENNDVNVLVSDWSSISYGGYLAAKSAIPSIGKYLGFVIDNIVSKYKISHKQFTLIGHSLGAHIAGAAGSATKEKVDIIIGLDAAGPLFNISDIDNCLDSTDADFVQAIHTSAALLGIAEPIGHSDYFPNGGYRQEGCGLLDIAGTCSHGRSYEYLAESISNSEDKFWSYECESYETFEDNKCNFEENRSFMGTLEPDRSARGSYYLNTNPNAPYRLNP